jgi:hypothetical protein
VATWPPGGIGWSCAQLSAVRARTGARACVCLPAAARRRVPCSSSSRGSERRCIIMAFSATDGGARSYQCAVELCGARLFYTEPLTHVRPTAERPGWRAPSKLPNKRAKEQPTKDTNPKANQTAQTEPIAIRHLRRSALETVLSAARAGTPSRLASLVPLAAAQPSGRRCCSLSADGTGPPAASAYRRWLCVCLFAERRARAVPAHDRMGPGRPLLQRCTDVAIYTIRLASPHASPMRVSSRVSSRVCRRAALGLFWV